MEQLNMITEDKVGLLAEISFILYKAKVGVGSIMVTEHNGKAFISLNVKDAIKAKHHLAANGYTVLEPETIVIRVKNGSDDISGLSRKLREGGITVHSLLPLSTGNGDSLDAIQVDKPRKAMRVLAPYLVTGE